MAEALAPKHRLPFRRSGGLFARALALTLLLPTLAGGGAWLASSEVRAATAKVVGVAAALAGDVAIRPAGGTKFAAAKLRQRVALADQVRTGEKSRLQLMLLDRSKFSIGPNALLTIDRFVYDPAGSSMGASVAKGAFRFLSGRPGGSASRTVTTPTATIGIRGTLVEGAVGELAVAIARAERAVPNTTQHDPQSATLAVLRGPGPGRQGNDAQGAADVSAAGRTVALEAPLQAAYVPYPGAEPIGPFTLSLPGLARLADAILPRTERIVAPGAAQPLPPRRERPRIMVPVMPGRIGDQSPPPDGGAYIPGMPDMGGLIDHQPTDDGSPPSGNNHPQTGTYDPSPEPNDPPAGNYDPPPGPNDPPPGINAPPPSNQPPPQQPNDPYQQNP